MPWVILDREGTLRAGGQKFRPGATEVDEATAERVRRMELPGVTVADTREQAQPDADTEPDVEPIPEAPEEPYERFQGRDGLWYYHRPAGAGRPVEQSDGYETEGEVVVAIEEDRREASMVAKAEDVDTSNESGPLLPSELTDSTFECRADDCKKVFKSTGARRNHERIFHRDLAKQDAE
jgi:hypothetical protein